MPGPLSDCYVLASARSADLAQRFLDEFLPERALLADPTDFQIELGLRGGSEPGDAFAFLADNPNVTYTFYFSNEKGETPYVGILAWTEDGSLILGLSSDEEPDAARACLRSLEKFSESAGYWSVETPPPGSRREFEAVVQRQRRWTDDDECPLMLS